MKRILLLLLAVLMVLASCKTEGSKPKDHLVENEDYIDLTSQYDGEKFDYNDSLYEENDRRYKYPSVD